MNKSIEESVTILLADINKDLAIAASESNTAVRQSKLLMSKHKLKELESLLKQNPALRITSVQYIYHKINKLEGKTFEQRDTFNSFDLHPSLEKLFAATEDKPEGLFWYHHLKSLQNEPEKRLKYALTMLPLPAAFREASIAYRSIIREKRKVNIEYKKLLEKFYVLLATQGFLYSPVFNCNVAESISKKTLKSLSMPYQDIGYNFIPAKKTDIKWFVDSWGEPNQHISAQEYHASIYNEAFEKYRLKIQIRNEKSLAEFRALLKRR